MLGESLHLWPGAYLWCWPHAFPRRAEPRSRCSKEGGKAPQSTQEGGLGTENGPGLKREPYSTGVLV